MAWWLWALVGIAMLAVEVAVPGPLVALFFAIGALAVSPLSAFGVGAVWQWIVFSAVSVGSLLLLRGAMRGRLRRRPETPVDSLVGQEAVVLADVPAGGEGKAELRGVPWSARAAAGGPLRAGERCRVERVDGVTLYVRGE
jgi:membrane protein implicated in regulation of membrane protease activity